MTELIRKPKLQTKPPKRILAIDPTHCGFGFAVLEGPDRLTDWGLVYVGKDKNKDCLTRIKALIERYRPNFVVAEDVATRGSRRGERVRSLVAAIEQLVPAFGVRFRMAARLRVRREFSISGASTKHHIALAIANRFTALRPILPRRRKCYMSEDERMAVFDAIAVALTHFGIIHVGSR